MIVIIGIALMCLALFGLALILDGNPFGIVILLVFFVASMWVIDKYKDKQGLIITPIAINCPDASICHVTIVTDENDTVIFKIPHNNIKLNKSIKVRF